MTITELVKEAYETAKSKGWHETERSPLEYHMLIVSELAEATESVRSNMPDICQYGPNGNGRGWITPSFPQWDEKEKPEGELIELADCIIRICDYAGSRGWDLEEAIKIKMEYNKTRDYRHGGKKY